MTVALSIGSPQTQTRPLADATGIMLVLPQYCAVHPDYRRCGHGLTWWRVSMTQGHMRGAAGKMLQAKVGGAAEHIYPTEVLRTRGFPCRQALN